MSNRTKRQEFPRHRPPKVKCPMCKRKDFIPLDIRIHQDAQMDNGADIPTKITETPEWVYKCRNCGYVYIVWGPTIVWDIGAS